MVSSEVPRPSMNMRLTDEDGRMTREAQRFFIQLWERTGGANDDVGGSLQSSNNLSDVDSSSKSIENLGFSDPILDKASPGVIGATAPSSINSTRLNADPLLNGGNFDVDSAGNVVVGGGLLGGAATDEFVYIPTVAGNPSGTPTTKTGSVAMIYDTVNDELFIYNGAWRSVALT